MSSQAVTLQLPLPVYEVFKNRAERSQRSVEVEIQELVTTVAEDDESLPTELAEAVDGLTFLDDEALWRAARSRVPVEQQEDLEALNFKQQSEGLTTDERQRHQQLLNVCDRVMLVRAHAARLLNERGHDVAVLFDGA